MGVPGRSRRLRVWLRDVIVYTKAWVCLLCVESNVPILFIRSVPKLFIKRIVPRLFILRIVPVLLIHRSWREEAQKYRDYILAAEYLSALRGTVRVSRAER